MSEERKLVTILFADVTESTALADTLDPEDVRTLMSRYYNHARQVVSAHGGTLEKFIGDAVMAVFGLPQTHGDDAERALAAALALREAIARDEVLGHSFLLRIGINTGEVIATSEPSGGDFLVTGDAVNMAARLQQCANPDEIVVGERTMSATQTAFIFEKARMVEVKGKRQPLRILSLKGQCQVRHVTRPPLVGRRQDLLQLALLQARTLEEQRPQLISIVAPAGIGKTRLLEEFLSRLDPEEGFEAATVRCLPYGQTLTYWPLRSLLTAFLGEEISKQHVATVFSQGGYPAEEAARLANCVLPALGIQQEGAIDRESIFCAWRSLIEAAARQAPRIIIFEDLQWASDSLLDMIEYLINPRTQGPIMFIALSRPELFDRRPTWGGGRPNFTSLALQPLTMVQTRSLIGSLTTDILAATREQIVERAGGNPFFALELLRGLSEHSQAGAGAALDTLPDTVHAAVLARLDLLSPNERTILQVASVAPRSFRPAMLHAVLPEYNPQEIEAALDALVARDFIAQTEAGADIFAFRHILISNVAYGTLSRAERIRLHGKIAAWLETATGDRSDEYVELIAYHYREAVQLARQSAIPLTLPVASDKALHFLQRAGELASYAGAFAEARTHLQHAINLAPESEHAHLYEVLGDCVPWSETSVEAYCKALEYWRSAGALDPLVGARLLRKLLVCYTRGHPGTKLPPKEEIINLRAETQSLAEAAGDEDELWRFRVAELFCYHRSPQDLAEVSAEVIEEKRKIALAAAEHFKQKGDWAAFSEALDGCAALAKEIGAYNDMLEASQYRLTAPDLSAHERGDALQMIARAYLYLGDYDNCIATIENALAHIQPGRTLLPLCSGVSFAMHASFITGRWSKISKLTPALEEMWEQSQFDPGTLLYAGQGYFTLLQLALAHEDSASADLAASRLKRIYPDDIYSLHPLLNALLTDCPQKLTFDHLERTAKIPVEIEMMCLCNEHGVLIPASFIEHIISRYRKTDSATRYIEIARALAAEDYTRLERAIDEAEAHHLVVHTARMRIVLAQHTGDRAQLARARSVLAQLGDRHSLLRLEEVEASMNLYAG